MKCFMLSCNQEITNQHHVFCPGHWIMLPEAMRIALVSPTNVDNRNAQTLPRGSKEYRENLGFACELIRRQEEQEKKIRKNG